MAQGDAGPLAQRMYAEINQARKLSGPRKREWPPAHDPVTRRDLTRYLELFSIVFDTLHFQASSVSHIVLPANVRSMSPDQNARTHARTHAMEHDRGGTRWHRRSCSLSGSFTAC
jgi:hypothetical protein